MQEVELEEGGGEFRDLAPERGRQAFRQGGIEPKADIFQCLGGFGLRELPVDRTHRLTNRMVE